jgi:hypothetical protein
VRLRSTKVEVNDAVPFWWAWWTLGWFTLLPFVFFGIGVIYLLDWLFPKKRLGTWFLDQIGA